MNDTEAPLLSNSIIGDYLVDKQIGQGGFSYTYLVTNECNDKFILKELFPYGVVKRNNDGFEVIVADSKEETSERLLDARKMFVKESDFLANASIPNVPKLIKKMSANNTLYLVLDYVNGTTLDDFIPQFQSLSDQDKQNNLAAILLQLLNTLDEVHAQGVLHRDLKSTNIIIRSSDRLPVLIDFGGVRFQIGTVTHNLNERPWSPGFSSPEQISGKPERQGRYSDIYSLAACFYHLLFSEIPPDSKDRRIEDFAKSFTSLSHIYPEPLLLTLDKAFNISQSQRYQTANEWLEDLSLPSSISYTTLVMTKELFENITQSGYSPSSFYIGREELADTIGISPFDDTVSSKHLLVECIFYFRDESCRLVSVTFEDNNSSNGTTVIEGNAAEKLTRRTFRAFEMWDKNTYLVLGQSKISLNEIFELLITPLLFDYEKKFFKSLSSKRKKPSGEFDEKSPQKKYEESISLVSKFKTFCAGRTRRSHFIYLFIVLAVVTAALSAFVSFFFEDASLITTIILIVFFNVSSILIYIRRIRDAALSFWLLVIYFIPFLNVLLFLSLCILPSVKENQAKVKKNNRYGVQDEI